MRQNTNVTSIKRITLLLLFFFLCFNNALESAEENQPTGETGNELVGEMMKGMEDVMAHHKKREKALKALVSKPLTETQQELLSELLQHTGTLDEILSSVPYLAYLKAEVGKEYADFPDYVAAMPTPK